MKRLSGGTTKFLLALNCAAFVVCLTLAYFISGFGASLFCKEHVFTEWYTISETTCESDGSQESYCDKCGTRTERIIEKYGHYYVSEVTKQPTVLELGERVYRCFRCGDSYAEKISKLVATYTPQFVEPDGTHKGYILYVCDQEPSLTYTENVTYTEKVIPPTCKEEGYTIFDCNEWNYTYKGNYTEKTTHNFIKTSEVQPNCEDSGGITYICEHCHESQVTLIPMLGHDYLVDTSVSFEATCESDGYIRQDCKRCGYHVEHSIIKLGHDFVLDEDNSVAVTCEDDGVEKYSCSRCSETKEEIIEKLGHDYVLDEDECVEATCESEGKNVYVCNNCQSEKTETVDKLPHEYGSNEVCDLCGKTKTEIEAEESASGGDGNEGGTGASEE